MAYKCIAKQGNLLNEEDATFIVNASNTSLLLGSGVSMAFKKHCGISLQKEMATQLEKLKEPLQKGDVVITSSQEAKNFKYALHVAVMDYNRGVRGDEKLPSIQDMSNALENIEAYVSWYVKKVSQEKIKLVLPLMGCGVGGLDKKELVLLYKNFFKRECDFQCSVIIYGYNIEDYKLIARTIYG